MLHRETREVLLNAAKMSVMLMFIIFNALMFSHVLTELRIPQQLASAIVSADMAPWMFLIIINLILLIGGQFMEPSGLLLIVAPIVYPLAMQLGIDPIHLGIIMVVNMEIGMITPPCGAESVCRVIDHAHGDSQGDASQSAVGGRSLPLPDHRDIRPGGEFVAA